jgi:hypothetical protein
MVWTCLDFVHGISKLGRGRILEVELTFIGDNLNIPFLICNFTQDMSTSVGWIPVMVGLLVTSLSVASLLVGGFNIFWLASMLWSATTTSYCSHDYLIYSRVFSPFHITILWLGFCRGLTVHNRAYDVELTGPHHWCLKCSCCLSPHCIDDATHVGPLPNGLSQNWGPQVIVSKCPISHVSMFNNL